MEGHAIAFVDGTISGGKSVRGISPLQVRCPFDGEIIDAVDCWYCKANSTAGGCHLMHKPLSQQSLNNKENKKKTWITRIISDVLGR